MLTPIPHTTHTKHHSQHPNQTLPSDNHDVPELRRPLFWHPWVKYFFRGAAGHDRGRLYHA